MASCSICGRITITVTLVRQSSSGSVPSCMDQVTCDAELCCWSIQWLLTCDVVLCCWSVQSQFSGVVENCLTIYKLSIYLLYGHINVMLWWLASCSMFISIGKMFYFNLFTKIGGTTNVMHGTCQKDVTSTMKWCATLCLKTEKNVKKIIKYYWML